METLEQLLFSLEQDHPGKRIAIIPYRCKSVLFRLDTGFDIKNKEHRKNIMCFVAKHINNKWEPKVIPFVITETVFKVLFK